MAKKLNSNIDYFEGFHLLGLVSQLRDYRLAYFLNYHLDLDLKKFSDLEFYDSNDNKKLASWYYYLNEQLSGKIYMIANSTTAGKLIPSQKEIDYFLLFKDFPSDDYTNSFLPKLRAVTNVLAVFTFDLNSIKDADLLVEHVELHEIEQVLRPQKLATKKPLDFSGPIE